MSSRPSIEQTIFQSARTLFIQHGWSRVSIEDICQAATTSRVTFYKYFRNKKDILKQIILEHKDSVQAAFIALANNSENIQDVMQGFFAIQQESLQGLYSSAFLQNLENIKDNELKTFFHELEQEKHLFMAQIFRRLQDRKIMQGNYPIALIDRYFKMIDGLMHSTDVQQAYQNNTSQLPKDILHLIMHGFAYQEH